MISNVLKDTSLRVCNYFTKDLCFASSTKLNAIISVFQHFSLSLYHNHYTDVEALGLRS